MSSKKIYRAVPPTGTAFMMSLVRGVITSFKRGNSTTTQVVDEIYLRAEVLLGRSGFLVTAELSDKSEEISDGS